MLISSSWGFGPWNLVRSSAFVGIKLETQEDSLKHCVGVFSCITIDFNGSHVAKTALSV